MFVMSGYFDNDRNIQVIFDRDRKGYLGICYQNVMFWLLTFGESCGAPKVIHKL